MKVHSLYTIALNIFLVLAIFHFANPSFTEKNPFDITTEKSVQKGENLECDNKEESEKKLFVLLFENKFLFQLKTPTYITTASTQTQTTQNNPYKPPIFS